jgi:hypothetical protein
MTDATPGTDESRLNRFRQRYADRRALRADRRARRKARVGGDPDSTISQAASSNFDSGGYFTKNTNTKP